MTAPCPHANTPHLSHAACPAPFARPRRGRRRGLGAAGGVGDGLGRDTARMVGGGGGGGGGGEGDDVVLGLDVPHAHKAIRRPRPQDKPVRMELRVAAAPSPSHACRLGAVSRAGVAPARTRLGSSLGGPRHRGRTCAKAPHAPTPTIAAPGAGPADTRATGASRALGRASY